MDSANAWPLSAAAAFCPTGDARAASGCPPSAAVVCGLDHLKRRSDYVRVARRGWSRATPGVVVQVCRQEKGDGESERPARIGVTVTRKVGNAVTRNRVRRRLRAVARTVMPATAAAGFDYVLIGRPTTADRPFATLIADLEGALKSLGEGAEGRRMRHRTRRD
jgi:ribonuclease P protein component